MLYITTLQMLLQMNEKDLAEIRNLDAEDEMMIFAKPGEMMPISLFKLISSSQVAQNIQFLETEITTGKLCYLCGLRGGQKKQGITMILERNLVDRIKSEVQSVSGKKAPVILYRSSLKEESASETKKLQSLPGFMNEAEEKEQKNKFSEKILKDADSEAKKSQGEGSEETFLEEDNPGAKNSEMPGIEVKEPETAEFETKNVGVKSGAEVEQEKISGRKEERHPEEKKPARNEEVREEKKPEEKKPAGNEEVKEEKKPARKEEVKGEKASQTAKKRSTIVVPQIELERKRKPMPTPLEAFVAQKKAEQETASKSDRKKEKQTAGEEIFSALKAHFGRKRSDKAIETMVKCLMDASDPEIGLPMLVSLYFPGEKKLADELKAFFPKKK